MYEKQILLIPGPTMIPPRVLRAMAAPSMGHRSEKFSQIIKEVSENLKKIFQTKNDVYILTSSGSGAMEASVVNFINPQDKVIVLVNGKFGDRYAKINERVGAEVIRLDFEPGVPADPEKVREILAQDTNKEIKAVFVQQNETSTGILNDIKAIKEAMGDHPALLIVDSISGMAVADFPVDEWGADVVVAGSQKAFMIPPGLAFITVSEKAWKVNEQCRSFNFYFDLRAAKKNLAKNTTPYTPATSLIIGLKESIDILLEEGLENISRKQLKYKEMVREAVKAMGLELLVQDEKYASPAITAIKVPENIAWKDLNNLLVNEFNVMLAGGQDELKGKIFRIGHIGYVHEMDLVVAIAALEMALYKLGYPVELGTGVKACQEVILKYKEVN
ncbi:MAG: alanine--glyoxylate aminotransferase family protein [Clostridia bacterium]|nr:alanine--glyoxylate aminotransferase family protein [Clostridia bacterium]